MRLGQARELERQRIGHVVQAARRHLHVLGHRAVHAVAEALARRAQVVAARPAHQARAADDRRRLADDAVALAEAAHGAPGSARSCRRTRARASPARSPATSACRTPGARPIRTPTPRPPRAGRRRRRSPGPAPRAAPPPSARARTARRLIGSSGSMSMQCGCEREPVASTTSHFDAFYIRLRTESARGSSARPLERRLPDLAADLAAGSPCRSVLARLELVGVDDERRAEDDERRAVRGALDGLRGSRARRPPAPAPRPLRTTSSSSSIGLSPLTIRRSS